MRHRIVGAAVFVLSCIFLLAIGELAMPRDAESAWHDANTRFDPEIGWVPIPSRNVVKNWGTISTNAHGFRSPELREATRQVAILGDSVVWGYGVDGRIPFAAKLDATLQTRGLQVLNLGVSGYGVGQSALWFERSAAAMPELRHVVLGLCSGNDISDTRSNTRYGRRKPLFRTDVGKDRGLRLENSTIRRYSLRHAYTDSRFLRTALSQIPGLTAFAAARMGDVMVDRTETDAVIGLLLERLRSDIQARGAKLHIVLLPSRKDLAVETEDYRLLREVSRRVGIPPIEVLSAFRAPRRIPTGLKLAEVLYLDRNHLQPLGHTLVAAELAKVLNREHATHN